MSNPTTMSYGSYDFSPVPFMRLGRNANKTGAGEILGFTWAVSLNGDLVSPTGNLLTIDYLQDSLASGLAIQGQLFEVGCGGDNILSVYPKINSLNFEEGVWFNRCSYSIEMEFDELPNGTGEAIADYNEDWSFEFVDEKTKYTWTVNGSPDTLPTQLRITHNLSATGKSVYQAGSLVQPAWHQARVYVNNRLGLDTQFVENSGTINLSSANFAHYNHFRTVQTNESAGTYAVNESWLSISNEAGIAGRALEDFTISIRTGADTSLNSVGIEGTIQGLETRSYGSLPGNFAVSETKYAAASGYWNSMKTRLYHRCNLMLDTVSLTRDLNTQPLNTNISHNMYNGTISYNYEYNDRPGNCIAGAITENFSISYNKPAEVWARIFVLGRGNGPVLQQLNTYTEETRSMSIEATFIPPTGCTLAGFLSYHTGYGSPTPEEFVDSMEDQMLTEGYEQIGRIEDTENFNPKTGVYSRNVTWLIGNC